MTIHNVARSLGEMARPAIEAEKILISECFLRIIEDEQRRERSNFIERQANRKREVAGVFNRFLSTTGNVLLDENGLPRTDYHNFGPEHQAEAMAEFARQEDVSDAHGEQYSDDEAGLIAL